MAGCMGNDTLPMATLIAAVESVLLPNSIWAVRMAEGLRDLKWSDSSGWRMDAPTESF
jgi:hypothetical protein